VRPVVIVVEDQDMVRKVMVRVIESLGFTVLEFPDAFEAEDFFRDDCEQVSTMTTVHAIVSDCDCPEPYAGLDVLEEAQISIPDARRILMSGRTCTARIADAIEDGVVQTFLEKPFARLTLALALGEPGEER